MLTWMEGHPTLNRVPKAKAQFSQKAALELPWCVGFGGHHRLDGHEFEWTPGVDDGQGGLACCGPWVAKSLTHLSNWTEVLSQISSELDVACGYHQSLPAEGRSLSSTRCLRWGGRDSFWGSNRENVWMRKVAEWWITSNENTISPTKKWDVRLNEGVIDPIRGILKYSFVQKNPVGLPWWLSGYEPTCQWRRYGFDPWSGK